MIQGAIIGGVVGLVFYFIQKAKEKKVKENDMLDDNLIDDQEK
jgi:hypothetical protein